MPLKSAREIAREKAQTLVASVFAKQKSFPVGSPQPGVLDTATLFADGADAALLASQNKPTAPLSALLDDPPAQEVVGPSKRIYHSTSLCCLRPHHPPRRAAIFFVEGPYFDPFILMVIMMNCFTMAWESPLDPPGTWKADFIGVCEWFYLIVFTVELLAKVVAYGLLMHEHAYLRDSWCQLDFVVVTLAWLPIFFPSFGNYSVLRAFRALRPLRALKRLAGMPELVGGILAALPRVANVGALCAFVFLVFAIVGVETFKGLLHYRCALPGFKEINGHPLLDGSLPLRRSLLDVLAEGGAGGPGSSSSSSIGGSSIGDSSIGGGSSSMSSMSSGGGLRALLGRALKGGGGGGGNSGDPESPWDTGVACSPTLTLADDLCAEAAGGPGGRCAYFTTNPSNGLMSFDNVGITFITLLQAITFDDWTEAMYALMTALSPYVVIYFVAIVTLGGFFVVNLFLAVIFEEHSKQEAELEAQQYVAELMSEQVADVGAMQLARERDFGDSVDELPQLPPLVEADEDEAADGYDPEAADAAPAYADAALLSEEEAEQLLLRADEPLSDEYAQLPESAEALAEEAAPADDAAPAPAPEQSPYTSDIMAAIDRADSVMLEAEKEAAEAEAARRAEEEAAALLPAGGVLSDTVADLEAQSYAEWEQMQLMTKYAAPPNAGCSACCYPTPYTWRYSLAVNVSSECFNACSSLLVVVNMVLMTMSYEGMSDEYAAWLEQGASYITWIFIGEMALKIFALGCEGYWSDGWNQLDGSIVTMSIIEMVLTALFSSGGVKLSFLRILRMLRVLRVLRLMRSCRGMYKIIVTFVKSIPQMSNLFVLMFLFMVIFALLAMQVNTIGLIQVPPDCHLIAT